MTQAREPSVVATYFGPAHDRDHATIAQTFRPGSGWRTYPGRKRISGSWARRLRREGVTDVALACGGRLADFRIGELIR